MASVTKFRLMDKIRCASDMNGDTSMLDGKSEGPELIFSVEFLTFPSSLIPKAATSCCWVLEFLLFFPHSAGGCKLGFPASSAQLRSFSSTFDPTSAAQLSPFGCPGCPLDNHLNTPKYKVMPPHVKHTLKKVPACASFKKQVMLPLKPNLFINEFINLFCSLEEG